MLASSTTSRPSFRRKKAAAIRLRVAFPVEKNSTLGLWFISASLLPISFSDCKDSFHSTIPRNIANTVRATKFRLDVRHSDLPDTTLFEAL